MSVGRHPELAGRFLAADDAALEEFAQRVADLVMNRAVVGPPLVTAEAVAEYLGVERSWVYENAVKLGARRLGDGPKARLRFSLADVDRLLTCSTGRGSHEPGTRVAAKVRHRPSTRPLGTTVALLPIRGLRNPNSGVDSSKSRDR